MIWVTRRYGYMRMMWVVYRTGLLHHDAARKPGPEFEEAEEGNPRGSRVATCLAAGRQVRQQVGNKRMGYATARSHVDVCANVAAALLPPSRSHAAFPCGHPRDMRGKGSAVPALLG